MAAEQVMLYVPLLAGVAYAAAGDVTRRRIPNWLTFSLALAGLVQGLSPWGTATFASSLGGLAVGFALPWVGYVLGGMKAGDVKLVAAVGAWVGPGGAVAVFAVAAVTGLVFVIGQGLWERRLAEVGRGAAVMAINLANIRRLGRRHVAEVGERYGATGALPYAAFVLAGTGVVVVGMAAGVKGVLP